MTIDITIADISNIYPLHDLKDKININNQILKIMESGVIDIEMLINTIKKNNLTSRQIIKLNRLQEKNRKNVKKEKKNKKKNSIIDLINLAIISYPKYSDVLQKKIDFIQKVKKNLDNTIYDNNYDKNMYTRLILTKIVFSLLYNNISCRYTTVVAVIELIEKDKTLYKIGNKEFSIEFGTMLEYFNEDKRTGLLEFINNRFSINEILESWYKIEYTCKTDLLLNKDLSKEYIHSNSGMIFNAYMTEISAVISSKDEYNILLSNIIIHKKKNKRTNKK